MLYEVITVHWTFASGDPDKHVTPGWLSTWVLRQTRHGNILIFHINGRGYSTAKALPVIVEQLRRKGYRFTLLRDVLGAGEGNSSNSRQGQVSPPISF